MNSLHIALPWIAAAGLVGIIYGARQHRLPVLAAVVAMVVITGGYGHFIYSVTHL